MTTLTRQISEAGARDLQDLAFNGDTANVGDPFLALLDGIFAQTGGGVVDLAGERFSNDQFTSGMKTMGAEYLHDRAALRHYVSSLNYTDYTGRLGNRETALGDNAITQQFTPYGAGVKVNEASHIGDTTGFLINPKNVVFGVQNDIRISWEPDEQYQVVRFYATMRIDIKLKYPDAIVKYVNVGTQ